MPATLDNLLTNGHGLRVFCGACPRVVELDPRSLAKRLDRSTPLPEIGRRAKCSACGSRGGAVQVVAQV